MIAPPETITHFALRLRQDASAVVQRHTSPNKKQASFDLYAVLAPCLALCERCERDPAEMEELRRLFAEQPKGGQKRRYLEKGSDIYQLVCRFVFTETDRTNAARYAAALRQAGQLQINSDQLVDWLKTNGGVNALYFRRPLDARQVKTSCLRLAEQITFSRDRDLRLTLRWTPDNAFKVLEVSHG